MTCVTLAPSGQGGEETKKQSAGQECPHCWSRGTADEWAVGKGMLPEAAIEA